MGWTLQSPNDFERQSSLLFLPATISTDKVISAELRMQSLHFKENRERVLHFKSFYMLNSCTFLETPKSFSKITWNFAKSWWRNSIYSDSRWFSNAKTSILEPEFNTLWYPWMSFVMCYSLVNDSGPTNRKSIVILRVKKSESLCRFIGCKDKQIFYSVWWSYLFDIIFFANNKACDVCGSVY